jgi:amino acid permease
MDYGSANRASEVSMATHTNSVPTIEGGIPRQDNGNADETGSNRSSGRFGSKTGSERRYLSHTERKASVHAVPPGQFVPSETGSNPADEETALVSGTALHREPPNCVDRVLNALLPPGSIPASGFNLCAATLGAGTLGLPYAVDHTGAVVGSIMLVLCGAVTVYTIDLLILTLEKTGLSTYEALSKHLIGPRFEKFIAGLIILFCWGVACAYVVVIGTIIEPLQTIQKLPQGTWGDRLMTFIFWLAFMLPLSLLRDINSLRYASLVGFLATFYLVLAIVIYAASGGNDGTTKNIDVSHKVDLNFWSSICVYSFAYCCQTNAFEIYHELSDPTPARMKKAAGLSMSFCTAIYIIAGIAGLASFGNNIQSNILSNFANPQDTIYVLMAFVAITFTVTMAFPVAIFPTRDAVLQMLGFATAYDTPDRIRIGVCVALATSALIAGLFIPNVTLCFSILGGICGSTLGYCCPVIYAWRAGVIEWVPGKKANFILAWFVCIVGGILGILGTITTIIGIAEGDSSSPASNSTAANSTHNLTTTTTSAAPKALAAVFSAVLN